MTNPCWSARRSNAYPVALRRSSPVCLEPCNNTTSGAVDAGADTHRLTSGGLHALRRRLQVRWRGSLATWFEWNGVDKPPSAITRRYRLNGGAWHERPMRARGGERLCRLLCGPGRSRPRAGLLNQIIDIDPGERKGGHHCLELQHVGRELTRRNRRSGPHSQRAGMIWSVLRSEGTRGRCCD